MEINESDILLFIKSYQYSKAKASLSVFLKTIVQILQSQRGVIEFKSNDVCVTSIVFDLLSKESIKHHKSQYTNYTQQYKDTLRFLSENIFRVLNCKELVFNDEDHLENFIKSEQDIVDIFIDCKIDKKIKLLKDIHYQLTRLGDLDDLSPLKVIKSFDDILLITNSNTISELKNGISEIVTQYGGSTFHWENLKTPQIMDTSKSTYEKITMTDEPLLFNKAVQTDDLITNDGKILFADTVVEILGLGDVNFHILSHNSIYAMLNKYVNKRIKNIISSDEDISEANLKCMYQSYDNLCKFFGTITNELQILDEQTIIAKIKSMNNVMKKLLELFNINDEYLLYDTLKQQKQLVKTLNINFTNSKNIEDNISTILHLNNNSTLGKFVKDFKQLHETFLQCDFSMLFSVENIALLLQKLKKLTGETNLIKNQLSNKTMAYDRLNLELQPFLELEREMGIDTLEIVDFINSIYKHKPLNTETKSFFNSCLMRVDNFEELKKENNQLKSDKIRLSSDINNLEKEMSNYQTLQINNTFCNQKLLEQDKILQELRHENQQTSDQLVQLENEHEQFKNALIIAEEHNIERNKYIEDLENKILHLSTTR